MSVPTVVVAENVGKCYHVYDKHSDRLWQSLQWGRRKLYREFWALQNISFTVAKGDCVGIVGANGSGKSTLLQLLFGVLKPTLGRISVTGKVGGLLELGGGFNPEETGRENVDINASILGVKPQDMGALMDTVAAFADIGGFLDQPVKTYSSGMVVRLAFALQINVPCDILIVDEALAVGDELFQRKCYAALEKFRARNGTVLFVSHAASSVKQLCAQALFLDQGVLVQHGACNTVVDNYQKFLYMREPERSQFKQALLARRHEAEVAAAAHATAPPPGGVPASAAAATAGPTAKPAQPLSGYYQGVDTRPPAADLDAGLISPTTLSYQSVGAIISNPRIETMDGRVVNVLNPQERYRYCYRVEFTQTARNVIFGWLVKSTSGLELGGGAHDAEDGYIPEAPAGSVYEVEFNFAVRLYPGVYYLNCGVTGNVGEHSGFLHRMIDAAVFRVRDVYNKLYTGFVDCDYRTNCRRVRAAETTTPGDRELASRRVAAAVAPTVTPIENCR